ncbi:hypothetical protein BDR03DRAFT_947532 [Suillus americanus]|nr:hypothetical protein BDR03DRAFT_947532 [Suillus americanus]
MATFWIYDYISSLHQEWTFLLRSRWTKVKALYIVTRYVPFLIPIVNLYLTVAPNEDNNKCQISINVISSLSLISFVCSECFFIIRTYTLWKKNRILLIAMVSAISAVTVTCTIISFTPIMISDCLRPHLHSLLLAHNHSAFTDKAIVIPSCPQSLGSFSFFMPFILLFVFQLALLSLTLVRVMQSWQLAKGPLYAILVKHNIFYYACALLLSAVNVLVPLLPLSDSLTDLVPEDFEVFILAILATRMHLHIWHMDQRVDDSDIVVCISMSDMSSVDHTV